MKYKLKNMSDNDSDSDDIILIDKYILPDIFKKYALPSSTYIVFDKAKINK